MTKATGSAPRAFAALADLLLDMARVVAQLTPEEYSDSGVPGVSGSIGGHVRHCLDHALALEHAIDTGAIDYDSRRRLTRIERDREAAVLALVSAARRLEQVPDPALGRALAVRSTIAPSGQEVMGHSSVARELAFVVSHTIHHSAQMALLAARTGGARFPARFGLAPVTPQLAGAA